MVVAFSSESCWKGSQAWGRTQWNWWEFVCGLNFTSHSRGLARWKSRLAHCRSCTSSGPHAGGGLQAQLGGQHSLARARQAGETNLLQCHDTVRRGFVPRRPFSPEGISSCLIMLIQLLRPKKTTSSQLAQERRKERDKAAV